MGFAHGTLMKKEITEYSQDLIEFVERKFYEYVAENMPKIPVDMRLVIAKEMIANTNSDLRDRAL